MQEVSGSRFRLQGSGFRFRVEGPGFGVQGSRVYSQGKGLASRGFHLVLGIDDLVKVLANERGYPMFVYYLVRNRFALLVCLDLAGHCQRGQDSGLGILRFGIEGLVWRVGLEG